METKVPLQGRSTFTTEAALAAAPSSAAAEAIRERS
jgi:hypothetical protein